MPRCAILLCSLIAAFTTTAQTVIFTEEFEGATPSSLTAAGWTWTGNAPQFVAGEGGGWAVSKESADLSSPPLPNMWDVPLLFHPLPYDATLLYSFAGSVKVNNPLGGTAIASISLGWFHPTDGSGGNGQAAGSETWWPLYMAPTLQSGGWIPGQQFGVMLHGNPSATGAHFHFDHLTVSTQPNLAMFIGRVLLEGPYQPIGGAMNDALRSLANFPLIEPFTSLGFPQVAGGGGETVTASALTAGFQSGHIIDWVRLELRSASDPAVIVATRQAIVVVNGTVVASNGGQVFFNVPPGDYYVAVRHRNHLGCMSSTPVYVPNAGGGGTFNDFINSSYPVWGTNARKQIGSSMVLWAGNAKLDNVLKYTGLNNDRDPILSAIGGVVPTNTVTGYRIEDVNMDGVVKYTGLNNDRDIILNNIGGIVPTATRVQQLP